MEKIMVRKRVLKGQARCVRSAWIDLSEGKGFRSTKRLLEEFGWKKLMEQLFHEEPDSDELKSSTLYQAYIDISAAASESRAGCRENEDFVEMYKLSEEFALWLTGNIYIISFPEKRFTPRSCRGTTPMARCIWAIVGERKISKSWKISKDCP